MSLCTCTIYLNSKLIEAESFSRSLPGLCGLPAVKQGQKVAQVPSVFPPVVSQPTLLPSSMSPLC